MGRAKSPQPGARLPVSRRDGAIVTSGSAFRAYLVGTMRPALAVLLAILAAPPLQAETQDDVLQGRMLTGWKEPDGRYMAAVSLQLAPGWKTYWRSPGDAGIPPSFDWSGSRNLGAVRIHWPAPEVIRQNGMESIGYLDALTLPVEVTPLDPAKPVHLALNLALGVCHDICMPAELTLDADLSGPGARDGAIAAALAEAPLTGSEAGVTGVSCTVEPIDDGLRVTARLDLPPQGADETVVFETGEPDVWVSGATADREGPVLTAVADLVPPAGKPFALDRSDLVVTVLAQGRAVEIRGCPAP
jgi:DsbC/DsbD-like thiol-disulfide interchange protein